MPSIAQHTHCVDFFIWFSKLRRGREVFLQGVRGSFVVWRCIAEVPLYVAVCVGRKNLLVDISSGVQMVRDCRDGEIGSRLARMPTHAMRLHEWGTRDTDFI